MLCCNLWCSIKGWFGILRHVSILTPGGPHPFQTLSCPMHPGVAAQHILTCSSCSKPEAGGRWCLIAREEGLKGGGNNSTFKQGISIPGGLLVKGLSSQSALKLWFLKYFIEQIAGLSSFPLHLGYFNPDQFPDPVQCAAARSAAQVAQKQQQELLKTTLIKLHPWIQQAWHLVPGEQDTAWKSHENKRKRHASYMVIREEVSWVQEDTN